MLYNCGRFSDQSYLEGYAKGLAAIFLGLAEPVGGTTHQIRRELTPLEQQLLQQEKEDLIKFIKNHTRRVNRLHPCL